MSERERIVKAYQDMIKHAVREVARLQDKAPVEVWSDILEEVVEE